jgi:hypothetical protein
LGGVPSLVCGGLSGSRLPLGYLLKCRLSPASGMHQAHGRIGL